jgi:hypothetical protein
MRVVVQATTNSLKAGKQAKKAGKKPNKSNRHEQQRHAAA